MPHDSAKLDLHPCGTAGQIQGAVVCSDHRTSQSNPYQPGPVSPDDVTVSDDEVPMPDGDGASQPPQAPISTGMPRSPLSTALLVSTVTGSVLLAMFFVLSGAITELEQFYVLAPWIGWVYLSILVIFTTSAGILALRSWFRYQQLREVTKLRNFVKAYLVGTARQVGDDIRLRHEWMKYLSSLTRHADEDTKRCINQVCTKFNEYDRGGQDDIDNIKTLLLTPLDRRADAIIEVRSAQTAFATALASRSIDALIVFWQSICLIDQISQLYAGRPGVWGTLRLLRRGMAMVIFAEIADVAAQAAVGAVANKALAQLGGRVVEGVANGVLMIRLGEAIKLQCRPVPSECSSGSPVIRLGQALTKWRRKG